MIGQPSRGWDAASLMYRVIIVLIHPGYPIPSMGAYPLHREQSRVSHPGPFFPEAAIPRWLPATLAAGILAYLGAY